MAEISRPAHQQRSPEAEQQEVLVEPETLGEGSPEINQEVPHGQAEQTMLARIDRIKAEGGEPRQILETLAESSLDDTPEGVVEKNSDDYEVPREGEYLPPDNDAVPGEAEMSQTVNPDAEEQHRDEPVIDTNREEVEQPEAVSPDKAEQNELHQEILKAFPELAEQEEGEMVLDALAEILEAKQLTLEEIKLLVPKGFVFLEDQEVPERYQPKDPNAPREMYICGGDWREGQIRIHKEFFSDARSERRAHSLGHEIGEMAMRKSIEKTNEQGEKEEDRWVDILSYIPIVNNRPLEWNSEYVQAQAGEGHYWSEMLAEDIAFFLRSDSPRSFLLNRIAHLPEDSRTHFQAAIESNSDEIIPMLQEATAVYNFLSDELKNKKKHSIKGEVSEEYDLDSLLSRPETPMMHTSNPDTKGFTRLIDWLFFAGQPPK